MQDPFYNSDGSGECDLAGWISLEDLNEPGAYVCRGSGDLVRVTNAGQSSEAVPLLEQGTLDAVYVTQISGNPYLPIVQARMEAANRDLEINF